MKFDIISIGDATCDIVLELDEKSKLLNLDKKSGKLCFAFPDKIPVKKATKIPATGNAVNFAIGVSRLGLKTGLFTVLGKDSIGKEILKKIKKEKIAQDYIKFDEKRGSNLSVILNYQGERTILTFHEKRKYLLPKFNKTKWIYYSSLAPGHEIFHKKLPKLVKKEKIKLAFNPGSFQIKEGILAFKKILEVCQVFLVNKEEAKELVGNFNEIKKLLKLLKKYGSKIVVITDGKNGSFCFDGENFYYQEIFPIKIIDKTGAGDSYSAGFVAALVFGFSIQEAMRWGTLNSAYNINKVGAHEGLLRKSEMIKTLKENPNFKPKLI